MVVHRFIFKIHQITVSTYFIIIPKTGVGLPKTGVRFCWRRTEHTWHEASHTRISAKPNFGMVFKTDAAYLYVVSSRTTLKKEPSGAKKKWDTRHVTKRRVIRLPECRFGLVRHRGWIPSTAILFRFTLMMTWKVQHLTIFNETPSLGRGRNQIGTSDQRTHVD